MAFTPLPTINPGDTGTSDWANQVKENFDDHEGRLAAIEASGGGWSAAGTQSIADNTATSAQFTTEDYDYGGWGLTVSNTTATVPAGAIPSGYTTILVDVGAFVEFANDADGRRIIALHKNGSQIAAAQWNPENNVSTSMTVNRTIKAVAGDTFTVQVLHVAGAALDINAGRAFWIARRGPAA